jgi:hypothetical protein
MSVHAFPAHRYDGARRPPLDEWWNHPFDLVEGGLERLRRQEGLKILVDVASRATQRGREVRQ